jgi:hypothetical protein
MPPPDVTFYRYFQTDPRPRGLAHIKGRQDIDVLPADFQYFLTEARAAFNHSFELSEARLADMGLPMTPYLDYLESREACAHAFESEGYHFIGISIPMIEQLRDAAERLVGTEQVISLLGLLEGHLNRHNAIGGILNIKLPFVTAHEFGHHLWGHAVDSRPESWNNRDGREIGSLKQQAEENLADSFAAFFVLGSLIAEPRGGQVLEMLGHHSPSDADSILLTALLLAVFSLFSAKSDQPLDSITIYELTHPPAIARVSAVIQTARVWCQRYRPELRAFLTQNRIDAIMSAEESSRPGAKGCWARQREFFQSPDGQKYYERLSKLLSQMPNLGQMP